MPKVLTVLICVGRSRGFDGCEGRTTIGGDFYVGIIPAGLDVLVCHDRPANGDSAQRDLAGQSLIAVLSSAGVLEISRGTL